MLNNIKDYSRRVLEQGADVLLEVFAPHSVLLKLMTALQVVADCEFEMVPSVGFGDKVTQLNVYSRNPFASLLAACEDTPELLNKVQAIWCNSDILLKEVQADEE